jgi:Fur family ferric uptake transcriptional regulator
MLVEAYNAEKIKAEVKEKFVEFLEKHQQRKTPERFAILDEIYSNKEHFDVETLFEHMKARNYRVSRATVYNTLDLLLDCGLVIKHQFGRNISRYERAYGFRQHDHLICNHCNDVLEFCDPRIQQIKNTMGELMQFTITNHSLYLFGEPVVDSDSKCVSCKKIVKKEK